MKNTLKRELDCFNCGTSNSKKYMCFKCGRDLCQFCSKTCFRCRYFVGCHYCLQCFKNHTIDLNKREHSLKNK